VTKEYTKSGFQNLPRFTDWSDKCLRRRKKLGHLKRFF